MSIIQSARSIVTSSLVDITPTSLTTGYGESVCTFLNILADCALNFIGQKWETPVYSENVSASDQSKRLLVIQLVSIIGYADGVNLESEGDDVDDEDAIAVSDDERESPLDKSGGDDDASERYYVISLLRIAQ